MTQNTFY